MFTENTLHYITNDDNNENDNDDNDDNNADLCIYNLISQMYIRYSKCQNVTHSNSWSSTSTQSWN